ncbi:hypothetical protein EDD11_007409 [Mortierella claussenii]|nr:hypothetical protein EDD11_007409 [Mortierella claussenii]
MTDIGPQPSNSQVPVLRSPHLQLVRQRSYSKIGGPGFMAPSIMSPSMSSPSLSTADEKTALGMSFPPSGPLTGAWEGIID